MVEKLRIKTPEHLSEYERGMHKSIVHILHSVKAEIIKLSNDEVEPNTTQQIHSGGRKAAYNKIYQKLINRLNKIEKQEYLNEEEK